MVGVVGDPKTGNGTLQRTYYNMSFYNASLYAHSLGVAVLTAPTVHYFLASAYDNLLGEFATGSVAFMLYAVVTSVRCYFIVYWPFDILEVYQGSFISDLNFVTLKPSNWHCQDEVLHDS
ncbi:hypothetical protein F5Y19DRAFT_181134 [Xylariaceae sp. FL1651]|nr:hypothetical protein F5Y19DRAFT_181134 [Xylariaceae sp. FL1651]